LLFYCLQSTYVTCGQYFEDFELYLQFEISMENSQSLSVI